MPGNQNRLYSPRGCSCVLCDVIILFHQKALSYFPSSMFSFFYLALGELPAGWVDFGPRPADPALPSATKREAPAPCQLRYESLTAGALSLPQGRRAPYPHGFFICGSCRINALFLPSQTGTMDQHFLSPLLISSCSIPSLRATVCVSYSP